MGWGRRGGSGGTRHRLGVRTSQGGRRGPQSSGESGHVSICLRAERLEGHGLFTKALPLRHEGLSSRRVGVSRNSWPCQ